MKTATNTTKTPVTTRAQAEREIASGKDPQVHLKHPNYHVRRKAAVALLAHGNNLDITEEALNVIANAAKLEPDALVSLAVQRKRRNVVAQEPEVEFDIVVGDEPQSESYQCIDPECPGAATYHDHPDRLDVKIGDLFAPTDKRRASNVIEVTKVSLPNCCVTAVSRVTKKETEIHIDRLLSRAYKRVAA